VSEALAQLQGALDFLNATDAASLPGEVQARVLRELECAEARHTATRARFLAAFTAQAQYEADGQGTARAWLKWQTQVTSGAAAGAVGWANRLAAHPVIDQALVSGELSTSWAKQLCAWTDRLPHHAREDADQVLCDAAADGGMALRDLGGLAEEIYQRTRPPVPSSDADDRFEERFVQLGKTLDGAGRVEGDLTAGCAHVLSTVLDALGKRSGPEDTRTAGQRRHDALEEACRRLIKAGMVPGRAAQPTQLTVHMTLHQLLGQSSAGEAVRAWVAAQASTRDGWLSGAAADAAACDATITPVVTGHLDPAALDRLTDLLLAGRHASSHPASLATGDTASPATGDTAISATPAASARPPSTHPPGARPPHGTSSDGAVTLPSTGPSAATRARLRRALLGLAIQALSGPGGLAAHLRATLTTPPNSGRGNTTNVAAAGAGTKVAAGRAGGWLPAALSLPLDIGAATPAIPAHLRKAAAIRHAHCAFPGCRQPYGVCDLHHLIPRSEGGPTSLANLVPLCQFHHLTAIHRWGWTLRLHSDGTTVATSPDGSRVFHSHSPPGQVA
jgi:hypothetical protein